MKKRPNILVVGSLVMDLIVSARRAPSAGETVIGTSFRTAPGGKGANQAVQCARLGAEVTMVGRVGADAFGDQLLETMRAAGVDVTRVARDDCLPTAVGNILLEETEQGTQNRITVVPGANWAVAPEQLDFLGHCAGNYDMLLLQLEVPMQINLLAAGYAKAAGVPVLLNPAPAAPLTEELLSAVACIAPNEHEAAALTGIPIRADEAGVDLQAVRAAAQALRGRGPGLVIVTLGGNGAALLSGGEFAHIPPAPVERAIDPTAAGDCFVGAFATAVCAGLEHDQAARFAAHAAALSVTRMGAMPSLPALEDVTAFLRRTGAARDLSYLSPPWGK